MCEKGVHVMLSSVVMELLCIKHMKKIQHSFKLVDSTVLLNTHLNFTTVGIDVNFELFIKQVELFDTVMEFNSYLDCK